MTLLNSLSFSCFLHIFMVIFYVNNHVSKRGSVLFLKIVYAFHLFFLPYFTSRISKGTVEWTTLPGSSLSGKTFILSPLQVMLIIFFFLFFFVGTLYQIKAVPLFLCFWEFLLWLDAEFYHMLFLHQFTCSCLSYLDFQYVWLHRLIFKYWHKPHLVLLCILISWFNLLIIVSMVMRNICLDFIFSPCTSWFGFNIRVMLASHNESDLKCYWHFQKIRFAFIDFHCHFSVSTSSVYLSFHFLSLLFPSFCLIWACFVLLFPPFRFIQVET